MCPLTSCEYMDQRIKSFIMNLLFHREFNFSSHPHNNNIVKVFCDTIFLELFAYIKKKELVPCLIDISAQQKIAYNRPYHTLSGYQ